MIAAIDETVIEFSTGHVYVVAGVAILADENEVRTALERAVLQDPQRHRPFHWVDDGPTVKASVIDSGERLGVVGYGLAAQSGRKGQDAARERILTCLLPRLQHEGAERIFIESRSDRQDVKDKRLVAQLANHIAHFPEVVWRPKSDAVIWLADALCGALRAEYLWRCGIQQLDPLALQLLTAMECPTFDFL